MTLEFTMPITITYTDLGRARVAILRPEGALNRSNFDALIAQARAAREAGAHHLIVDLRDVAHVGTAGLVALYAVARLAQGAAAPNPEAGWAAIRALAEDCSLLQPLAVVHPRPQLRQALACAPFNDYLAIHTDLDAALGVLAVQRRPVGTDKPLASKGANP